MSAVIDKYTSLENDDNDDNDNDDDLSAEGSHRCCGAIGLIFMGLSALSFSIMSLLVHILSTSKFKIPSFELVAFRTILGIAFSLGWVIRAKESPFSQPKHRCLLGSRAAIGVVGMSCNWYILGQLPLGDATVIIFTSPIFTMLVARIVLKETLTYPQLFCVFVSSIGVLLVARPTFLGFPTETTDDEPSYAEIPRGIVVVIGLIGAMASAATNILVRKLTKVHAMVTVLWLMSFGFVITTPITLFLKESKWPVTSEHWIMVLFIGVLGFTGQGFKTQGLKWEQAGIGSMMRNLDLVLAFIFQITLLGEKYQGLSVIGATLTLLSSVGMGYLKVKERRQKRKMELVDGDVDVQERGSELIAMTSVGIVEEKKTQLLSDGST